MTDLGTEFGVEVGKEGSTVSRVFRGKVVLAATHGEGREQAREITLEAGQSARVERPGKDAKVRLVVLQPIGDVPANDFVRHLPSLAERQKVRRRRMPISCCRSGRRFTIAWKGQSRARTVLLVFDSAPGGHHGKAVWQH